MSRTSQPSEPGAYWSANLRLISSMLLVWFVVSYGAGILLRGTLDRFSIGGAPLGFWFAQQGSIYVFVALIFIYCSAVRRLERKYRVGRER